MSKKTGATRTTISVPADLKKRMEKVKEPVNWSALACQAFEAKLVELSRREGARDMASVVERLRASKLEADSSDLEAGFSAGEKWAKTAAEYTELRRLAEKQQKAGTEWESLFAENAGRNLLRWLHPEPDYTGDGPGRKEFWESAVGEGVEVTNDLVRGFAEGALQVWHAVKDEL